MYILDCGYIRNIAFLKGLRWGEKNLLTFRHYAKDALLFFMSRFLKSMSCFNFKCMCFQMEQKA